MEDAAAADRERLIDLLELAAEYLRAEADATIEATIDQAEYWPKEQVDALLEVLSTAVTAEDHFKRDMPGPLPPTDKMMGRLLAKHTPMRGNGEPLDLAAVTSLIMVTAGRIRALGDAADAAG